MVKQTFALAACFLLLASAGLVVADEKAAPVQPPWIRDLDMGKQAAKTAGKDLLIVFTGHGWCAHCEDLDREVFRQAAFMEQARRDYVLVELDFTFGATPEEKARQNRYRKLQEKYLIRGFPTVVLADAAGVPYAIMTGYAKGVGPTRILAPMRLAQLARVQRDLCFKLAESATGMDRAVYFHKGIQSVAWFLGTIDDRGDDPVLVFYPAQVQDILKADQTDPGKLRKQYEARRKNRADWIARESVFAKLKEFDATKDYRGAIKYLAEALQKTDDRKLQWRMECSRNTYLEWDGQHEEALKNVRRLSKRTDLSEKERDWLLDREAYNLFNLGRIDEGLANYDRRIAAAQDNPKKRLDLLGSKAEMIRGRDRPEQAMEALRAYREATKPGSEDWLRATSFLADELRQGGQHRAALKLVSEYLAVDKAVGIILDAAESHIALGENEPARAMIAQAEAASSNLKESTREVDIKIAAFIEKRIKSLRMKLEMKKSQ